MTALNGIFLVKRQFLERYLLKVSKSIAALKITMRVMQIGWSKHWHSVETNRHNPEPELVEFEEVWHLLSALYQHEESVRM
jgi:hypothetical protein